MESIWEIVVSDGIFACLFVWLLFYILKDSSRREKKYMEVINQLAKQIDVIEDVKEDVAEIKEKIFYDRDKAKNEAENQNI